MVKSILKLGVFVVGLSLMACSSNDNNNDQENVLSVSTTDLVGDSHESFTKVVEIKTDLNWETTADQNWVSISPSSGVGDAEIEVTADNNDTEDVREATVMVITDTKKRMISVVQPTDESLQTFEVSPEEISGEGFEAFQDSIYVDSGLSWEATSEVEWIELSATEGKGEALVVVSIGENNSPESREGVLSFSSKLGSKSVKINQPGNEGLGLFVSPELIEKETAEAFTDSLEIKTTTSWKIENEANWVTTSEVEGEGDVIVAIEVDENEEGEDRETTLKVVTDFEEKKVAIIQPGT